MATTATEPMSPVRLPPSATTAKGVCGVAGGTGNSDGVKTHVLPDFLSGGSGGTALGFSTGRSIMRPTTVHRSSSARSDTPPGATSDNAPSSARTRREAGDQLFHRTNTARSTAGCYLKPETPPGMSPTTAYRPAVTAFSPDTCGLLHQLRSSCNIAAPGGDLRYSQTGVGALDSFLRACSPTSRRLRLHGNLVACPHVSIVAALGLVCTEEGEPSTGEFKTCC